MTLQELKYRVLLRLGVVAAGDSPNADDGATVELRYRALYNMLESDRLTRWNLSEDIPDEYEAPIIAMTAAECARDFGNADPGIQVEGKYGLPAASPAERQLRRLLSTTYVSTPAKSEYF
jgi:hypothetical protein